MKECTDWTEVDYLEATCPYCHVIDTHCSIIPRIGLQIKCNNDACKKWFRLGERE